MTDQIEARPLRLLVVDDHEVVRQGLVSLLERREHFQVVAEAGTAAEAVEMARKFEPDLVVMDVRLPDGSGIEACREIRAEFPGTRVVILTSYPDEEAVLSAIIAGASGYLLKQIRGRDLMTGIPKVIKISYSEIAFAIDKSVSKIEEAVLKALEISPPELSADIYDNGIHLTGGGALLRGLDKRLALKTKLPIHITEDPLKAVVRGTGIALKNISAYKSILMT